MDAASPPIRVVFINMRRLLRDLICELLKGESTVEVAGAFADARAAGQTMRGGRVDLVVAGGEGLSEQDQGAVLEAFPGARVLAVSGTGGGSVLYRPGSDKLELFDLSVPALLAAMRANGSVPPQPWTAVANSHSRSNRTTRGVSST